MIKITNTRRNTVKIATATNIATANTPTIFTNIPGYLKDRSISIVYFLPILF